LNFREITAMQQATWSRGDFNEVARQVMPVSAALVEAVDPHADQRVLDIACGSGNAALVAARRYCDVTGIDYVPALIERAKVRAAAEGTRVDFQVADAQALPFADAAFDAIVSVFGIMFAPDQERAAAELLRVCRPGGRIGIATWPPEGYVGEYFITHSRYLPPPPGIKPPLRWGTEAGLRELLGGGTRSLQMESRQVFQYFRSPQHLVEVFSTFFGPTHRVMASLDEAGRSELRRELIELVQRYNRATDGTLVLECVYTQVVAVRA